MGATRGFTLLELLVVLALGALATGLVAPAMFRAIEASRARGAQVDVVQALRDLPVQAFQSGQALSVDEAALRSALPDWPDGWQLHLEKPLRYGPTGVAEGGALQVVPPNGRPYTVRVMRLTGEPLANDNANANE